MIQVEHLSKTFGSTTALKDVSFEVRKGEVLGFLGPNGAGKTTTMRVIAGLFPATAGKVSVAGFDVFEKPLEVKRRIGYLPENPPLYTELSVDQYLRFVARIKGVTGSRIDDRIAYVQERCGLEGMSRHLIKHLSKGFKQRVGLAQSLIHDPAVLILDEPTVGLDPKQIIEVRDLIRSLGGDHTIILSTHILPEVSATCERVVIINQGKIVAVDSPDNLTDQLSGGSRIEVEVTGPTESLPGVLASVPGISRVTLAEPRNGHDRAWVESESSLEVRPVLVRRLFDSGFEIYEIRSERMSLEEVFLKLTTEEAAAETEEPEIESGAELEQEAVE